jgi:hypothetical protein
MLKAFLTLLHSFYFYFFKSKSFSLGDRFQVGISNNTPLGQWSWAVHQRIVIGPHLSWPDIHQIFRTIKKNNYCGVWLVFEAKNWTTVNSALTKSYYDWLSLLFNRYEIPKNVLAFQFLDKSNNFSFMHYRLILENIIDMVKDKVPQINRNIISYDNLVMPPNTKINFVLKVFDNTVKNYAIEQVFLGPQRGARKILWPFDLYKKVKYLLSLDKMLNTRIYLIDHPDHTDRQRKLSYFISRKIFKEKLQLIVMGKK